MRKTQLLGAVMGLCAACIAHAHHSFAMFDFSKSVELSGTIKAFQWTNPHSWLDVVVKDASGAEVVWGVEMGSPSALYRAGWRQAAVKPGEKVSVMVHPLRDGRPGGSLVSATLADGSKLGSGGRSTAEAATVQP
jgi:hypothetical protein